MTASMIFTFRAMCNNRHWQNFSLFTILYMENSLFRILSQTQCTCVAYPLYNLDKLSDMSWKGQKPGGNHLACHLTIRSLPQLPALVHGTDFSEPVFMGFYVATWRLWVQKLRREPRALAALFFSLYFISFLFFFFLDAMSPLGQTQKNSTRNFKHSIQPKVLENQLNELFS